MPNVQRISFVLYAFHTFYIVQQIPMPTVEYDLFLCLLYTCSRFSNLLYCTLDLHAHCAIYFQAYCTSVQEEVYFPPFFLDTTEYLCRKDYA
jgi:hypothetical protein